MSLAQFAAGNFFAALLGLSTFTFFGFRSHGGVMVAIATIILLLATFVSLLLERGPLRSRLGQTRFPILMLAIAGFIEGLLAFPTFGMIESIYYAAGGSDKHGAPSVVVFVLPLVLALLFSAMTNIARVLAPRTT